MKNQLNRITSVEHTWSVIQTWPLWFLRTLSKLTSLRCTIGLARRCAHISFSLEFELRRNLRIRKTSTADVARPHVNISLHENIRFEPKCGTNINEYRKM